MATNTVRSVVIFSVIAIGFIGLTAGGMFLLKSRNHTFATTQSKPTEQQKQPEDKAKTEAAKTEEKNKSTEVAKSEEKPKEDASSSTTATPPAPDNSRAASQAAATATPTTVPATGPSLPGMIATTVLMMAAAYFGMQLFRARAAYRRHLEG